MTVSGSEGCLSPVEMDVDAGQHWSALIAGGGDHRLLDRILELGLVDFNLATIDAGRDGREVRRVDSSDGGVEAIALDRQRLRLLVQCHRQRLVGVRGHEVCQQPRRYGDPTFFLDLGRNDLADTDLQVGRGQLQPGVASLQQNVVEDG